LALVAVESYSDFGNLIQVDFDSGGRAFALTLANGDDPAQFHMGGTANPLPAGPSYFAVNNTYETETVVMPGPDHVVVYGGDTTGTPQRVDLSAGPGFLLPPGPNPGGGEASIAFRLVREAEATVSVFDVAGRRVAELSREQFPAGMSSLRWNGRDERGRSLPAGTYLVELRVGEWSMTRKLTRVR